MESAGEGAVAARTAGEGLHGAGALAEYTSLYSLVEGSLFLSVLLLKLPMIGSMHFHEIALAWGVLAAIASKRLRRRKVRWTHYVVCIIMNDAKVW